jgi:tetratricopeptide (TPR) repeat protein
MKALRILRLLQDDRANLSIQNGALDMLDLSCALHDLGMSEEAESTCTWAANLYKTLVRGHANSFLPYLATALYNLAFYRACIGDRNGSLAASQDCVMTYRIIHDTEIHQDLLHLAKALGKLATALLDVGRSTEALAASEESVAILRDVTSELSEAELLVASSSPGSGSEKRYAEHEEKVDLGLEEEGGGNTAYIDEISMLSYHLGLELHSLSVCLEDGDRYSDAYDAAKEALNIFRTISKKYPGTFDGTLADGLWYSSHYLLIMDQPSEALPLLEEAVPIYRILAQKRPTTFSLLLIRSLCKFATLLRKIGRDDDALAAGDEAVRSWRSLVVYRSDFALHQPNRLEVVCSHLRDLGRNEEALALIIEAVDAYRTLVKGDPVVYSSHLALGLAALAQSFYTTQRYDEGIEAAKEAVKLYRTLSEGRADLKDGFLKALNAFWFATEDAQRLEDLIAVGTDVISVYRTHAEDRPTEFSRGLATALLNHSSYLCQNGQYFDALTADEEAVDLRRSFEDSDSACDFVVAANCFGIDLYNVGRVEQAIAVCQEAITIGRGIIREHPHFTSTLVSLLTNLSDCFRSRGQFTEALTSNEEAVSLSRSIQPGDPSDFARELRELSVSLSNAGRSQHALQASEEAVEICRKLPQSQDVSSALAYSLDSLGNCLASVGREKDALAAAEEAVTLYGQITPNYRLRTGCYDHNIADALYDFSARLAAAGRPADALANMRDAASIYRTVVTTRAGYLPKFAMVVHSLSVRLWEAGHQEEGIDSWKEEVIIRRRLASVNPDLAPMLHDALCELSAHLSQVNRLEEASVTRLEARKVRDEHPGVFEDLPPILLSGLDSDLEGTERDEDVVDVKASDASKIDRVLYVYGAWVIALLKVAIVVPIYLIFRLVFRTDYYLM